MSEEKEGPLGLQRSEAGWVASLTPGKEALLVSQQAGCRRGRQEGGDSGELEEAAHRGQVPLPEGGVKGEGWHLLQASQGSASRITFKKKIYFFLETTMNERKVPDLSYRTLWLALPDLTLVDFTQSAEDLRNKTKSINQLSFNSHFHHVFLQTKY